MAAISSSFFADAPVVVAVKALDQKAQRVFDKLLGLCSTGGIVGLEQGGELLVVVNRDLFTTDLAEVRRFGKLRRLDGPRLVLVEFLPHHKRARAKVRQAVLKDPADPGGVGAELRRDIGRQAAAGKVEVLKPA